MAPEPPHHLPMIRLGCHRLHGGHRFGVLADGLAVDLYPPRLHRFWYFADEIDLKQAVFKRCLLDLDMIGQAKAPLERPRGDALVESSWSRPSGRRPATVKRFCCAMMVMSLGEKPATASEMR
jgi:hypothetical protein